MEDDDEIMEDDDEAVEDRYFMKYFEERENEPIVPNGLEILKKIRDEHLKYIVKS